MTVYFAPKNNYYGSFLGALGQGAAGIVTNLLGNQIAGMMDRAKQARDIKLYGKVMADLDSIIKTPGATKRQIMGAALNNPNYAALSEDTRNRIWDYANHVDFDNGLAQLGTNWETMYGSPSAGIVTGAKRAGFTGGEMSDVLSRAAPQLTREQIDLGNRVLMQDINPYKGAVEGSQQTAFKGISPDEQLKADVEREGYKNARDIASLESGGRIGAARIAAEAQGRGARATDFGNYVKYAEMLQKEKDGLAFASAEDTAAQDRLKFINNELELVGETLAQYYRPELFAGLPAGGVPQPQVGPPSEEGIAVQMMKNNPELTWGEALRGARELQSQQKK